jgi:hypothetical protein
MSGQERILVGIEQAFVVKSQAFVRQSLQYSRAPDRNLNLFVIAYAVLAIVIAPQMAVGNWR